MTKGGNKQNSLIQDVLGIETEIGLKGHVGGDMCANR
jgi:hypothetical protein